MSSVMAHLSTALADRYRIERELGQGHVPVFAQIRANAARYATIPLAPRAAALAQ